MLPLRLARPRRAEQAPSRANGFGVPGEPLLGSPSPCHPGVREGPRLQARTAPAWPRVLRAPPHRTHPTRLPTSSLQTGLRRDARRGRRERCVPAAGSLTHLRRRRPPAPPAAEPRPRAAALASRPPAAALRLGRARPPHSEQRSPRPLFPQPEGRGGEGTPWVGRNGAGHGLALPLLGRFSGAVGKRAPFPPPSSAGVARLGPEPHRGHILRKDSGPNIRARALGTLRKVRSSCPLS